MEVQAVPAIATQRRECVNVVIVRATMREVKRLQRKHNQGKKWNPVPPGSLRRRQRTRDELRHRKEGE